MTLANKLTLGRGALGVCTFVFIWLHRPVYYGVALALYVAAIITDSVDGYLARKTRSVTSFGAMADPIADKVLVIGTLLALLHIRSLGIPSWAVFLIIVRDLAVGGLRALVGAQGRLFSAEKGGKIKMVIQSGGALVILIILVLRDTFLIELPQWVRPIPSYLVLLSLVSAWVSALIYFHEYRQLLKKSLNTA